MKIDIHVHTKCVKSGDAPTRNVTPERFCETVLNTDVRILCIANHNAFDVEQFRAIESQLGKEVQVWPGIELDVIDDGSRGHLLVIVSPEKADQFSTSVLQVTKDSAPDAFDISIENILEEFDYFGPIYVAHYKQKKPDLSDESIDKLTAGTQYSTRVLKEVTNSISAGIYISHGYPSIYGSDVNDWSTYESLSQDLPDLRLPVDSFDHFCLLLEKDPTTINTMLERKTSEELVLHPFDDGTTIEFKAYNDINVFFGAKGTGKSCILESIASHYSDKGIDAQVFIPGSDRLDEIYDTKGKDLTINLEPHDFNYCTDEIAAIKNAREADVTSLSQYVEYFRTKSTNKNARKILIKDLDTEGEKGPERKYSEYSHSHKKVEEFIGFLTDDSAVRNELENSEIVRLMDMLSSLKTRLENGKWRTFVMWKEIRLLNAAIRFIRHEVGRKTGSPSKPATTGFRDYGLNRIQIESNAGEVLTNSEKLIPERIESVGDLGPGKGFLKCRTEIKIQNGGITDSSLLRVTSVKKSTQKSFIKAVRKIAKHVYSDDLFHCVAKLNDIEDVDEIKTIHELLLFKRYFALDGEQYSPSSGEASMLTLQKELEQEKDIYILDEPERSLGHDYINDVIVPLLKEKARQGKRIFISTHDANIAVRTLPYSSVYRCHGPSGYDTYVGNPFSNSLRNINDESEAVDWKKISMRTLEGGEEAFGERGKIYGNN